MKIYQQGAQISNSNRGTGLFSVKITTINQIGKAYLQFDITLRRTGNDFSTLDADGNINEPIGLVNNAFAYAFSTATLR